MRAGGCTVQQALAPEAAVVVKQAVSLARRRGNAQVTPLHVASAMLHQQPPPSPSPSAATGLLRAACLQSHSHPLQCKALELCFNVALNRLPASASPLLVGGHGHGHVYYPPSLSNALVAAFKRAQAHQRRGSSAVDAPPQPVAVAVKIELEQLVISILDDPSVSRVMREAGFSSTQVKANVEQAVVSSIEANSSASVTTAAAVPGQNPNPSPAPPPPPEETKPSKLLLLPPPLDQAACDEDVAAILDCLASRSKKRVMVVAECAAAAEAPTRAAVEKIKRGEALPLPLPLRGARVVSLRFSRFRDLPRDEAERLLVELRCAVKVAGGGGGAGVVLVVEDLGWAAEFWAARAESAGSGRGGIRWPSSCCGYYCAVEHAVAEVRALACRGGGDGVWLVGYGTYQSYMRCRAGQPSLETLWGLQTLAVPAGSLALSLNFVGDSTTAMANNHQSISKMAKCDDDRSGNGLAPRCLSLLDAGGSGHLTAVSSFRADEEPAVKSSIPAWLQHCRDQEPSRCKKSSTCGGSPSHHHRTSLNFSTVVSPSSSSVSSYEQRYHLHQPYQPWLVVADAHEAKARCAAGAVQLHVDVDVDDEDAAKLLSAIKVKSHDSSASNGSPPAECWRSRFKELSAENLKVLCTALEKEVPWQAEIVPEIASTVLRCRSGMAARRRRDAAAAEASGSRPAASACGAKEDTWMLFHGGDAEGKARVARELARLVFGSRDSFVSIGGSVSSSSPAPSGDDDSSEQQQRKRPRAPLTEAASGHGWHERLYEAVRDNPHRVIMVEVDVEEGGWPCRRDILEAVQSGLVRSHAGGGGDEAAIGDAIVVLSCRSLDAWSTTSSPPTTKKAKAASEEEAREEESTGDDHERKEAMAATAAASPSSSSPCFDLNMDVENNDLESCFADASLLKAVDRTFFFRRPDESSD